MNYKEYNEFRKALLTLKKWGCKSISFNNDKFERLLYDIEKNMLSVTIPSIIYSENITFFNIELKPEDQKEWNSRW